MKSSLGEKINFYEENQIWDKAKFPNQPDTSVVIVAILWGKKLAERAVNPEVFKISRLFDQVESHGKYHLSRRSADGALYLQFCVAGSRVKKDNIAQSPALISMKILLVLQPSSVV